MMGAEVRVWCALNCMYWSWWHLLCDYCSELLLSKQEVSLFCLSKGDQMAVGVGPDPGERGLWAGRVGSLRVSSDGIRRDRACLSTDVILGAPKMCPAPQKLALAICYCLEFLSEP